MRLWRCKHCLMELEYKDGAPFNGLIGECSVAVRNEHEWVDVLAGVESDIKALRDEVKLLREELEAAKKPGWASGGGTMARTVRPGTLIKNCRFTRTVTIDGTLLNTLQAQAAANCRLADALYTVVDRAMGSTERPMLTIVDKETDDGKAKA